MPIQQEPESTVRMILCRSKFLLVQKILTGRSIGLFCICLMCVTRTKHGDYLCVRDFLYLKIVFQLDARKYFIGECKWCD